MYKVIQEMNYPQETMDLWFLFIVFLLYVYWMDLWNQRQHSANVILVTGAEAN